MQQVTIFESNGGQGSGLEQRHTTRNASSNIPSSVGGSFSSIRRIGSGVNTPL